MLPLSSLSCSLTSGEGERQVLVGKRAKEAKEAKDQEDPERTQGRTERRRTRGILSRQRHLTEPSTDLIGREFAAGEHDGHTGPGMGTMVKMSPRRRSGGTYLAPTK